MPINPLAGQPAPAAMLINPARLVTAYYSERPDPKIPSQRVTFGTSGHRGSAFQCAFNEWHILAITQAIVNKVFAAANAVHAALQLQETG
jgi:phosphoglucomutase